MIKFDSQKEIHLLKTAVGNIQDFGDHFVAYNTEFLGISTDDNYVIKGQSTRNSKCLNEICFGYDMYDQLHLLEVYVTSYGTKYASTEIMMGTYGYWLVSVPGKNK